MIEKVVLNGEEHKLSPDYKDIRNKPSINGVELKEGDNKIEIIDINIDPDVDIVEEGETPSVINTGTSKNPTLKFSLPKGDTGDTGNAYVPSVDENGNLSFTNTPNDELPSELPSYPIKGPRGIGLTASSSKAGKTTKVTISKDDTSEDVVDTFDIEDGADAINPFKGWFISLDALKAAHTAVSGDYAYVKGTTSSDPVKIYEYSSSDADNHWTDSGREFNSENDQTFATSQNLNEVEITQGLNTGGINNVPSAEAVKGLNIEVNGDLVQLSDIISKATEVVADITSNGWDGSPVSGSKRAGRLSIKDEYKQIRVVGNNTTNTYFFFATKAIPSNTDLTLTQLNDYFCSDDQAIHIAYSAIRLVVPIGAKYLYYSKKDSNNILRTPTAIIPLVKDGNGIVDKLPPYSSAILTTKSGGVGITDEEVSISDNIKRRHSLRLFNTSDIERVSVANGFLVCVIYFNANLKYQKQSDYAQSAIIDKSVKYVLFSIKKSDDSDFAETDNELLTIYSYNDAIKDISASVCENVSLKEMFDANMIVNSALVDATTVWTNFNDSNVSYDTNSLSFNKSFNAGPNHNLIYQSVNLKEGHKYLIACESKVESVDSTKFTSANNMLDMRSDKTGVNNVRILGLYIYGQSGASGFATPLDKYRIALRTFDVPVSTEVGTVIAKNFSFGNIGPAGAIEGYVRNPVLIDLTELGLATVKRGELFKAYRDYVNYFICQSVSDYNASLGEPIKVEYSDCEARSAFVEEMNNIASELGCANSVFCNPSGVYTADHLVTCKDFLKIGAAAMTENAFLRIINTHEMDVPVVHSNGNADVIANVVAGYSGLASTGSDVLLTDYDIVAAKTGSWDADGTLNDTQTLVMVVRSHATGKFIVGYIHHGGSVSSDWYNAKYNYIKSLFDKVEDETTVLNIGTTTNYSAGYISPITQWAKYVDWGTVNLLDTETFPPASTTKYLSCMIVLQHLQVDEIVEYVAADWSSGSGAAVTAGDKFRVRDAVFCCMASSSNSLANMLARWCGYRLLEEQNK